MNTNRLKIFYGEAIDPLARVYVEYTVRETDDYQLAELDITGKIVGPRCEYAKTLPCRLSFRVLESGGALLAEAVVPDPCFWTPAMPLLYDVRVEVQRQGELICSAEQSLGIRRLGRSGQDLWLERQRWVMRGAALSSLVLAGESEDVVTQSNGISAPMYADLFATCHEAGAALILPVPDDATLEQASRVGTLLLTQVSGDAGQIAKQLERLGRWPAAIAVFDAAACFATRELELDQQKLKYFGRNLLAAQHVQSGDTQTIAPWAEMVLLEGPDAGAIAERAKAVTIPALAYCPTKERRSVADARAACDRLQSELAQHDQFAGYLV